MSRALNADQLRDTLEALHERRQTEEARRGLERAAEFEQRCVTRPTATEAVSKEESTHA